MGAQKRGRDLEEPDVGDLVAAKQQATKLLTSLDLPSLKPSRKRQLDNEDENGAHNKRYAVKAAVSIPTGPSLSGRKRPLDEADDVEPERRKRQEIDETYTTPIDQKSRMELYQILRACKTWETYRHFLNLAYKVDESRLALALNDSPEKLRLKALTYLDDDRRARIIDLIFEIQLGKYWFDPSSLFPSVMTRQVQSIMLILGKKSCLICDEGFDDSAEYTLKNCREHIMHTSCLIKEIAKGNMPLIGPCGCVGLSIDTEMCDV
jgi:hypothetical protein